MEAILIGVLALAAIYVGGLALVVAASLRPPRIPLFFSPGEVGLPQEDAEFLVEGSVRRGWWESPPHPRFVAVLGHGYVMNRSEMAGAAVALAEMGGACLLFDFRAHGRSEGRRSTLGWEERWDWVAAVKVARERFPGLPVLGVGNSMGGAAAAFAAVEHPGLFDALVLDSVYNRLSDVMGRWWGSFIGRWAGILLGPTVWVARPVLGFSPREKCVATALAAASPIPVLLLHGRRDSLATAADAEANRAAAGDRAELVWFDRSGHCEPRVVEPERFRAVLRKFVESWLGNKSPTIEPAIIRGL